jgi:Ser/Thr protein kinase RdoA (MazF antagonist)
MLSQYRPRFSAEAAVDVARRLYSLEVEVLEELPSERDQDFHLRDRTGSELVLKLSNTEEPRSVLELQNEALRHVARRDPEILIPQLRELGEGGTMTEVEGDDGASYPCRLFNYLLGRPLALSKPHPESLLRSVGRLIGRLDRALEGLHHDSPKRKLNWQQRTLPIFCATASSSSRATDDASF